MLKLVVLCCVVAVWLQVPNGANAVCCRRKGGVCGDCRRGSPYCGNGGCNVFGCNCDGGCRSGWCDNTTRRKRALRMRSELEDARDVIRAVDVDGDGRMSVEEAKPRMRSEPEDASDVIRTIDGDGDGKVSVEEAKIHLTSFGFPSSYVERALKEVDVDQDLFVSEQEIDSY